MIIVSEITGQLHDWTGWTVWGNSNERQSKYPTSGGLSRRRLFSIGSLPVASIWETVHHCRCRCDCCACHSSHRDFRIRVSGQSYHPVMPDRFPTFELALARLQELVG